MYITNVASHLGAWLKFRDNYPAEFQDLHRVAANVLSNNQLPDALAERSLKYLIKPDQLSTSFNTAFADLGWQTREQLIINGKIQRRSVIDATRNSIGVEFTFGKFFYTESVIFVKFPLFINANKFKIGLVVTPTKSLVKSMSHGVGSFEMVRDRIKSLAPLPFKYPFAIIGISDQYLETTVEELTSKIDRYLFETLGLSLAEMTLQTEKQNYDFKETLSGNQHNVAKEVCAFANLSGGGLLLIGITDAGEICGIPRNIFDETERRLRSIAAAYCSPVPEIECVIFYWLFVHLPSQPTLKRGPQHGLPQPPRADQIHLDHL